MTAPTSTTESAGKSLSMKDRARAALLADPEVQAGAKFSCKGLRSVICDHERPDITELYQAEKGRHISPSPWLAALRTWEAENPVSDGNMRRICEGLTAEGVLTKDLDVRGKYKWAYYRLAAVPA